MPFLNDQEFEDLQDQIKNLNSKNEELENELNEKIEEIGDVKSVARNRNILLSALAGICLAFAIYAFQKNPSAIGSDTSNSQTASITSNTDDYDDENDNEYEDESEDNSDDTISASEKIESIKDGIKDETVYSVQIGAFTEKRYPLLSKTIAGTLSDEDYLRYSIGLFLTLKEAQDFRRQLIKYGFSDAFVASYINGKRQEIHKPY